MIEQWFFSPLRVCVCVQRKKSHCYPSMWFYGPCYVFFFFSLRVTFNWSVRSLSRSVHITATKRPRQSAKTNPVSIYGPFTHFLFSQQYSGDSFIIPSSLMSFLSHFTTIFALISLKQQCLSFPPYPFVSPDSPFLPADRPAPISEPLCLPTCLPVPPSSFLFPHFFTHQSLHSALLPPLMDSGLYSEQPTGLFLRRSPEETENLPILHPIQSINNI